VPTSAWAQDAIASSPTVNYIQSDMVNWEGNMIVSTDTDLAKMTSGTWDAGYWHTTLGKAVLLTGKEHPLGVYNRLLLIGDANFLHTVDRNGLATASRITLPPEYHIVKIMPSVDKIWILTKHIYGGDTQIFSWDGFSDTYNAQYPVKAQICLSGVLFDNIPYITTSKGQILRYNGGGFVEAAAFPIFDENVFDNVTSRSGSTWGDYLGFSSGSRPVSVNGMAIIDDKVHILINGKITGDDNNLLENMPSGIWCLDDQSGLHHRFALSQYKAAADIVDYGTEVILHAGPLVPTDQNSGLFLAGASFYPSNAATEVSALFINDTNDTLKKRGYVVTSRLQPEDVETIWGAIFANFSKMKAATDELVIKKRQTKDNTLGFVASITWTSESTFTSTNANFANVVTGVDGSEIEVIRGFGAGTTAHISSVVNNAGTYTVTLDESIPDIDNNDTARVSVRNWEKIASIKDSDSTGILFKDNPVGGTSPWSDFKIELRGSEDSPVLEQISITNKVNTKANF
jgi:hypothetical protein